MTAIIGVRRLPDMPQGASSNAERHRLPYVRATLPW
jgi:hypothetical protein